MNITRIRTFIIVLLCFAFASCALFDRQSMLDQELDKRNKDEFARLQKDANDRALREQVFASFEKVRKLIAENDFVAAEEMLERMKALTEYDKELNDLKELLALAKKLTLSQTDLAIDQKTIINESLTGLQLPKKYNKKSVVNIVEERESPEYLEQLLEKHISMKVKDMSLSDFAMQLRDLEGLNIADPVNVIFNDEIIKGKTFSANFKDVPLREIFDYISYTLGVDFNIKANIIWVTKSTKAATGPRLLNKVILLRQGIIPTVPEGIGVATAKAAFETTKEEDKDLENALKAFYSKSTTGGSYTLFPQRNILLISDTLSNIREVEKLVRTFCKPPYQVLIEAKFISVSESDLRDVGVELSHFNGGKSGENISANNQENANVSDFFTKLGMLAADNVEGVGSLTLSGIVGNRSFDMIIRALEKRSSTVTLSAPRITALNNRTARIRKGDKIFYFEEYKLQTVDNGDKGKDQVLVPNGKPTSVALGITFDVKPNVGADGKTILLGLKPEIITFQKWEDYYSTQTTTENKVTTTSGTEVMLPRTHEQTIATSVSINSGETVILGGMVENREITVIRKIPLLGDIPLLGALFTHSEITSEPTNLLIFVTATVLNEDGEYVVAEEAERN